MELRAAPFRIAYKKSLMENKSKYWHQFLLLSGFQK